MAYNLQRMKWLLLALIITLTGVGVLALYSVAGGSLQPWALQQIFRILSGFAILFIVAFVPLRYWHAAALPIFLFSLALIGLIAVYGISVKGAQRWLELGTFRLQPSEITKIALIMFLAAYYAYLPRSKTSQPLWVVLPVIIIAIPTLMVALQPDLGTSILMAMGGAGVMFLAGVHFLYFGSAFLMALSGLAVIYFGRGTNWQILKDYQYGRIDTFLDPSKDLFGAGYHITQSKIAIGSGGLYGRGFLQGTQSQLNFIPEKHTDFVFTTLAEEFGLIWCLVLIGLYAAIIFLCYLTALRSKNRFGSLLAMGVGFTLFIYVTANLAMISGLIPVVGVPLPFISYGGSSLLVMMFAFGLVQSVSIHADRYSPTE